MEPAGRALAVTCTRCSACQPPPVCVLCLSLSLSLPPLFHLCFILARPGTCALQYEPAHLYPGYGKGQTYHHIIPHAGHMRLTAVSAPTFSTRTRPSVILAEIDRINHRMRPNLAYQPAEDFLNSRSIVVASLLADGRLYWPTLFADDHLYWPSLSANRRRYWRTLYWPALSADRRRYLRSLLDDDYHYWPTVSADRRRYWRALLGDDYHFWPSVSADRRRYWRTLLADHLYWPTLSADRRRYWRTLLDDDYHYWPTVSAARRRYWRAQLGDDHLYWPLSTYRWRHWRNLLDDDYHYWPTLSADGRRSWRTLFADGRHYWPAYLLGRCRKDSFRLLQSFDDEARAIRGQAAHLLKRIHTPVPRALRPLPVITTGYEYEETPLPPRITSDMYIQRLLGLRDVQHEVLSRSYYNEPSSRANIGKGHLACVQYAGGKAFSRRRPLASHENNGDYIRNNVKMLSHYERMREAAKSPLGEEKGGYRSRHVVRGPRPVNSGFYRPTNDPGKEYAEALASAAIATANFDMHTAALEENRKNKQKREDARLASAAEERDKEGESATDGDQEAQSAQVQKKLEEEVKRKAEEEAKRKAEEEAKKKAEEEAKKKAEEEAKKKAEEEAKKKAEEEAKKKAEEDAKKKAEEEAKKKAEEEAKKKAEEEAKRKAEEEEAKRKAEEEEAKRKAEEEEARKKAEEEEAKRKAEEEEAKRKEEEARIKAEEEEARRKQEEEEAKKKAEEEAAAQESEPAKEDDIDDIWAGVDEDMPRKKPVPEVTADTAEEETQPAGDQTESTPAEEETAEQGPEPVVEEPTSPETPAPADQPEIEEVPASEEE